MIVSPDVAALNPGVNVDTLRVKVDKPIESESPLESDLYAQIERAGLPLPNAAVLLGWRLFVFDSKMIKQPKDGSDSDAIATLRKAFEWLNTDEQKW
jgi:hypothetical protein